MTWEIGLLIFCVRDYLKVNAVHCKYVRDSRLLNITQKAGFFGSIVKQKIFCKSKVSVRKVYSGTKDSHDVMSWESFCTITGVVHNGCYSYRLPPKGLKELVLTYEL